MWRSTLAFSTCIGAVLVIACDGGRVTDTLPADNSLLGQLVAAGFRRDMIEDRGDYFLIEGDIQVSKEAVPRLAATPPRSTLDILRTAQPAPPLRPFRQWRTDSLVGQTQVQNILVDVSGLANVPDWQTAARDALVKWNTTSCAGVNLSEGTPADIVFSTTTSFPSNVAAIGSFPADAPAGSHKPGPTIQVNTPYTGTPNNALTKLRNMVHEIGHTIGFRHTNWQANGEPQTPPGANLITGTPQTDAASVMNGGTATVAWSGFSFYDRVAARTLYFNLPDCAPFVAPTLSFTRCTGFAGFAEIRATTNTDMTTLKVQRAPHGQSSWVTIGNFANDSAGRQHLVPFPTNGAQDVRAWSNDPARSPPDSPISLIGPIDC